MKRSRSIRTTGVGHRHQAVSFRPRLGRQLLYAGVTFAAMILGYWAGTLLSEDGNSAPPQPAPEAVPNGNLMPGPGAKAWYATQPQPPSLVTTPDTPLFPDPAEANGGHRVRAYEEALPQEIHAPRSIAVPEPVALATKEEAAEEGSTPSPLLITVVRPPQPEPGPAVFGERGLLTPPPQSREPVPEEEPELNPRTEPTPIPVLDLEPTPTAETAPESTSTPVDPAEPLPETDTEAEAIPKPETAPPPTAEIEPTPSPESLPRATALPEVTPETAPRITALPAWRQFAALTPKTGNRPLIAVVIDDMGVDRRRSAKIIGQDGPLTLSFLTYAKDLMTQALDARLAGHELMLHVPMEPSNAAIDPGPNVLATGLPREELERRLDWALDHLDGMVGINNHMGSRFTRDADGMRMVMEALKERGLLFLDSRTTGGTKGPEMALRVGVPFLERNVFLDNVNEVAAVESRLADLEAVALRHGFAIGIGHPRDATIEALRDWVPGMHERGFVLVPITTIMSRIEGAG